MPSVSTTLSLLLCSCGWVVHALWRVHSVLVISLCGFQYWRSSFGVSVVGFGGLWWLARSQLQRLSVLAALLPICFIACAYCFLLFSLSVMTVPLSHADSVAGSVH
jgi:hypothetical protein